MNRIAEEVESDPTLPRHHPRAARRAGGDRRRRDRGRRAPDRRDARALRHRLLDRSRARPRLRVARERPQVPIVAISPNVATGRRLSLVWGMHCVVAEDAHDQDDMVERACRIAFHDGFAKAGRRVIIVAGVPLGTPGATNMLRIAFVGAERWPTGIRTATLSPLVPASHLPLPLVRAKAGTQSYDSEQRMRPLDFCARGNERSLRIDGNSTSEA